MLDATWSAKKCTLETKDPLFKLVGERRGMRGPPREVSAARVQAAG